VGGGWVGGWRCAAGGRALGDTEAGGVGRWGVGRRPWAGSGKE
jgi:hypothetical protein